MTHHEWLQQLRLNQYLSPPVTSLHTIAVATSELAHSRRSARFPGELTCADMGSGSRLGDEAYIALEHGHRFSGFVLDVPLLIERPSALP